MKAIHRSKTLWFNAIAIAVYVASNYFGMENLPAVDPGILAIVNILLRLITKQPLGFAV